jgi:hypothetical protein
MARALDIRTPCVFASDYHVTSDATQRLVDLMASVAGTEYLTGSGSRSYLEESLFARAGIRVVWQEYHHPVYHQLYGDFVPMLSALDFLMMQPSHKNDHSA